MLGWGDYFEYKCRSNQKRKNSFISSCFNKDSLSVRNKSNSNYFKEMKILLQLDLRLTLSRNCYWSRPSRLREGGSSDSGRARIWALDWRLFLLGPSLMKLSCITWACCFLISCLSSSDLPHLVEGGPSASSEQDQILWGCKTDSVSGQGRDDSCPMCAYLKLLRWENGVNI